MSIKTRINAKERTPTALVYLDGKPVKILNTEGAISLGQTFGQPISGGTIKLANPIQIMKHKMPVIVQWGYDGYNVPAFMGFVTNPMKSGYPKQRTLQIRDVLWIADFTVEDREIVLDNKTHDLHGTIPTDYFGVPNWISARECIIRLLRDWAGIPEFRLLIPEIYTDEAQTKIWYLGQLTPTAWSGMSPLQICLQILSPLGYWLFCDAAGMVRIVQMSGAPSSGMSYVWREEENLLLSGAPSIDADIERCYNKVLVQGANTGVEGAQIRDSWAVDIDILPDGKHRTFTYSNSLIEYVNEEQAGDASCTGVARRFTREYARIPATITLPKVKAVPTIQVGSTVGLRSSRIDLPTDTPFFIYGMSTSFGAGRFESSLQLDGGVGEEGYTLIPPPIAAFTWRLMKETIYNGTEDGGLDVIELFLDGNASLALGGAEIVTWSWSDNSVPPVTGTGPLMTFIYPAFIPSVIISLTVTDTNSKTDTLVMTVLLTGDALEVPATRELNLAAGSTWYVTPDGGKTYTSESGQLVRAVPPIGSAGSVDADPEISAQIGLLATGGGAGAVLHSTIDRLATPSIALANVGGQINFIWQHEANPLRIWVAVADKVKLSVDGGVTFGPVRGPTLPDGELDSTVRWIVESKDSEGILDILIGRYVYSSFDSGVTWIIALEGPAGAIARNYASGFARHWVGYTNLPEGSSPLRSTEGDIGAWLPDVTPPVLEVRALTLMVTEPMLIVIDQEGRIWKLNAEDGGTAVLSTVMPEAP